MSQRALLIAVLVSWVGCDDTPPPAPPPKPKPAARRPPPKPKPKPVVQAELEAARQELTEESFVESIDNNRDPFRSYLKEFSTPMRRTIKEQRKVLMERFALDELRLIAVITGQVRPRAMFRAPNGLGVSVKRGDYIGKSSGKVKQILPDKVVVQITERTEDQQRLTDRVVELHSKKDREARLSN